MSSNPILAVVGEYLQTGQRIKAILISDKSNPNELIIVLERNRRKRHKTHPKDRNEFMQWWKQTATFLQIKLEKAPKPLAKKK